MEGAGVRLKRAFGNQPDKHFLDPFLLLDDFHSDDPDDYNAGFPWHPHRGIETVTYMIHGKVRHEDSMGNNGVIESGDVQWMTAGSGIVHSEMPEQEEGLMRGLQLWVNLPADHKMMDPRYQEVSKEHVAQASLENGIKVKVICGQVEGIAGPVKDIVADPLYLDFYMPSGSTYELPVKAGHTVFAYVLDGAGYLDKEKKKKIESHHLVKFKDGDAVFMAAGDDSFRFLLVAGKPIGEPVAWYGPIVMNTQEELQTAFNEYQNGTFIKGGGPAAPA
jgi:redox-sensitive bicupin YhaK (pirin superfamily)